LIASPSDATSDEWVGKVLASQLCNMDSAFDPVTEFKADSELRKVRDSAGDDIPSG
jgi:hypothetical protein